MRSRVIKINWGAGLDKLRYQPVLYMWVYFTRITSQLRKAGNNKNDINVRADKRGAKSPVLTRRLCFIKLRRRHTKVIRNTNRHFISRTNNKQHQTTNKQ